MAEETAPRGGMEAKMDTFGKWRNRTDSGRVRYSPYVLCCVVLARKKTRKNTEIFFALHTFRRSIAGPGENGSRIKEGSRALSFLHQVFFTRTVHEHTSTVRFANRTSQFVAHRCFDRDATLYGMGLIRLGAAVD